MPRPVGEELINPLIVKFVPACALHADRQNWLRRETSAWAQSNAQSNGKRIKNNHETTKKKKVRN